MKEISSNIYKYWGYIILLVLVIFSAIFLTDIFHNICIFDIDDLNSTYDSHPLLMEENGRYVCNFLSRVFCLYLPNLFHMHLQNAANTIGLTLYVTFIILLSAISAFFVSITNRSRFIFIYDILFVVALFHFLHYLSINTTFYFLMFSFQYGYVLATFFDLTFLYFLFDYFLNTNYFFSRKKLICFSLLGFCAGNSTQIITYTCSITIILFYLFVITEFLILSPNKKSNLKKLA